MCRIARKRIPASSDFLGKAVLPLSAILLFTVAVIFNCLTSSFAFADVTTTTTNPTDSENILSNSTTDESSTTDTQQQDNHSDGAQPQSDQRSTASSPQINIDESTSDQPVTDQPPQMDGFTSETSTPNVGTKTDPWQFQQYSLTHQRETDITPTATAPLLTMSTLLCSTMGQQ